MDKFFMPPLGTDFIEWREGLSKVCARNVVFLQHDVCGLPFSISGFSILRPIMLGFTLDQTYGEVSWTSKLSTSGNPTAAGWPRWSACLAHLHMAQRRMMPLGRRKPWPCGCLPSVLRQARAALSPSTLDLPLQHEPVASHQGKARISRAAQAWLVYQTSSRFTSHPFSRWLA